MKWDDTAGLPCSIARTMSVIGDRWTMLILRNAFLRMRRFEDFQANLGVTRHLLASRLKRLVAEGILARVPYQKSPLRHEYRLTDKGKSLHSLLMAIAAWGDEWMDQGAGPPMVYLHQSCGKHVRPVTVCSECHEPLSIHNVQPLPGPGLTAYMRRRASHR
jgi:DNA-binding HxlR family transcriptional regulator